MTFEKGLSNFTFICLTASVLIRTSSIDKFECSSFNQCIRKLRKPITKIDLPIICRNLYKKSQYELKICFCRQTNPGPMS